MASVGARFGDVGIWPGKNDGGAGVLRFFLSATQALYLQFDVSPLCSNRKLADLQSIERRACHRLPARTLSFGFMLPPRLLPLIATGSGLGVLVPIFKADKGSVMLVGRRLF